MSAADLHYSLIIQWDPRSDIYVVTVPELPGCRTHGATYEEAVAMAQDAIDTWVYGEDPATLPKPIYYGQEQGAAASVSEG